MATHTALSNLKAEPEPVEQDAVLPRFKNNAEVRAYLGLPQKRRELPPWTWVPNDEWQKLEGILSDHPEHDTTEMKRRNRIEEEEHDARKFGRTGCE